MLRDIAISDLIISHLSEVVLRLQGAAVSSQQSAFESPSAAGVVTGTHLFQQTALTAQLSVRVVAPHGTARVSKRTAPTYTSPRRFSSGV
jgi:hypothetical protein